MALYRRKAQHFVGSLFTAILSHTYFLVRMMCEDRWTYKCSTKCRSFNFENCDSRCMSNFLILDMASAGIMSLYFGKMKIEITFNITDYDKMTLSLFTYLFSHSFLSWCLIFYLSGFARVLFWLLLSILIKLKITYPKFDLSGITD